MTGDESWCDGAFTTYSTPLDIDKNFPIFGHWLWNLFDSNIAFAIEPCGLHIEYNGRDALYIKWIITEISKVYMFHSTDVQSPRYVDWPLPTSATCEEVNRQHGAD